MVRMLCWRRCRRHRRVIRVFGALSVLGTLFRERDACQTLIDRHAQSGSKRPMAAPHLVIRQTKPARNIDPSDLRATIIPPPLPSTPIFIAVASLCSLQAASSEYI